MSSLTVVYNEISEVAGLLHKNGWAEKNAGNFSILVDLDFEINSGKHYPLPKPYTELANKVFIVTGKGKRMRDIARSPAENTVVFKINSKGDMYSILSVALVTPTSELPTHLAIHSMIAQRSSNERAVMHSHVTELIALTHIEKYCDQDRFNNMLWQMHPETIMFIPTGVGFVPFELPGSSEIATATVEALKYHSIALWEKHGVFSIASNLNDCYDLIDIIAKATKIYLMCAAVGTLPQGLSTNQLDQLKDIEF
ncbi:MAG: rhamnulose-1-phosphate aldolase [Bacteroidetes bacterium]|nr:rhamnulose-1-phosphate aldolase [Bacteroidota bacterium]MBL6943274.1 rhamnulose-1-phosphate aldolase [Bacteroidales bacterium]